MTQLPHSIIEKANTEGPAYEPTVIASRRRGNLLERSANLNAVPGDRHSPAGFAMTAVDCSWSFCSTLAIIGHTLQIPFDKFSLQYILTSTLGNGILKMLIKLGKGGIHNDKRRDS